MYYVHTPGRTQMASHIPYLHNHPVSRGLICVDLANLKPQEQTPQSRLWLITGPPIVCSTNSYVLAWSVPKTAKRCRRITKECPLQEGGGRSFKGSTSVLTTSVYAGHWYWLGTCCKLAIASFTQNLAT